MIVLGRTRLPIVLAAAVALYALEAVTVGALVGGPADAAVLAIASMELTFGPAMVAYVAFVRRRRMAVVALAPILFLSFVVATVVIPKGHHQTLDAIGLLFAPIELAVVSLGIWKILGIARDIRADNASDGDLIARIERAVGRDAPLLAAVLATELAVPWYAFIGPFRHPRPEGGVETFGYRDSWRPVAGAIMVILIVETIGVHLLVSLANSTVALVLTVVSVYGILWLFADLQAARHRPITVSEDGVRVRAGLRWTIVIPMEAVLGIERVRSTVPRLATAVDASLDGNPTVGIELATPVAARGLYGRTREVTLIWLAPDDPSGLIEAVERHRAADGLR